MSGCSILIVEDDPGAAEAFVPMLTAHGYEVRIAVDAEAGFREVARCKPTVLLVDLHLPVVDGVEFLRLLRRSTDHVDLPVAMMTGDYLVDDAVTNELQALGAPLYFKPLWEEDLVGAIQRLVQRSADFSSSCRGKVRTAEGGC
jgi:DNA-binding response OmpR family regulator